MPLVSLALGIAIGIGLTWWLGPSDAKPKLGLLELTKRPGNVSQACKIMGYSRDTFYRYKELYQKGGEAALPTLP